VSGPHLSMEDVAAIVAQDIPDGCCVNLGIGLPLKVAAHVPVDRELIFHSENGVLGVGPPPSVGEEDWDLVDAGKRAITLLKGGSYISHVDSFSLIRGGYIDVAIMGAYQVSGRGDLANWWTGEGIPGVGGAMDLAACAKSVVVMMHHTERDGLPKIVEECTLPLTGVSVVTRIYTELGIFTLSDGNLRIEGLVEGVEVDQVQARTGIPVSVAETCYPVTVASASAAS
jgi:3-oxoadipate CoA-transferase, beta subunit